MSTTPTGVMEGERPRRPHRAQRILSSRGAGGGILPSACALTAAAGPWRVPCTILPAVNGGPPPLRPQSPLPPDSYPFANNPTQNDISIIVSKIQTVTGKPGKVADEAGDLMASASLAINSSGEVVTGVVGVDGDVDMYKITAVPGQLKVRLDLAPYYETPWNSYNGTYGQTNLKAVVRLRNASSVIKFWSKDAGALDGDLDPVNLTSAVRCACAICILGRAGRDGAGAGETSNAKNRIRQPEGLRGPAPARHHPTHPPETQSFRYPSGPHEIQGAYWLSIEGAGEGASSAVGFTNYDSAGPYKLTVSVPRQPPVVTCFAKVVHLPQPGGTCDAAVGLLASDLYTVVPASGAVTITAVGSAPAQPIGTSVPPGESTPGA